MQNRKGLLLINLGTPEAPTPQSVRAYLKEFLMDPRVIDIPGILRWFLVTFLILPFRPAKAALAYQKIWTDRGSPLLFHLMDLVEKVRTLARGLSSDWVVEGAMRYGQPSFEAAVERLRDQGVNECVVIPLYPQYSTAATLSSIEAIKSQFKQKLPQTKVTIIESFYDHPAFIEAFCQVAKNTLSGFEFDHLLMSFHGLPERQIKNTHLSGSICLLSESCCESIGEANKNCYRAQCFQTAKRIAQGLGLKSDQYTVCFQSRLGRTPWIQPYTDTFYRELGAKGVRRLAVMCPAFVADCLETLEEVQIRGEKEFIEHGGQKLKLVPSLNSNSSWAQAVAQIGGLIES